MEDKNCVHPMVNGKRSAKSKIFEFLEVNL